jgi:putative membrane protein
MDEMVSDHEDDVAAFEDYVENAQDQDLRAFAEESLPTLQEHLELARQTQEQVVAAGDAEQQPDPSMAADEPTEGEQGFVSLEEVLGSSVVNENGEEVGTIEDLVIKDEVHYAVLSVGGFLGLGEKDVAIPLDELKLGEDESYLMSTETEGQLEELPEYEATQYQPYQR